MSHVKDFQVISKLGEGAYSSVYKVKRLEDGEQYALKRVNMQNLSEKERQNALNEVRILASVRNPNIICYKEAFLDENSNSLCIIMEYADNEDLFQKISDNQKKNRLFKEEEIWNVIIQVVKGLKALHDLRIYHRDLKSANVFMNKDGTVKLGDMNVSKVAKKGLLYTQTGTPYYASPEVWKEQPYDNKSDLWSLGCVIYEMTTLRPPFKANDMMGLYKKVIRGQYPKIPTQYSQDLANIIKALLQVSPQVRPNCDKLLQLQCIQKRLDDNKYLTEADEGTQSLLKTIVIPRKFHYLTSVLPKANYEPMKLKVGMKPRSLSQIGSLNNIPEDDNSSNTNKHQRFASEMKENNTSNNSSNKFQLPKIFNNLYGGEDQSQQRVEYKKAMLGKNLRNNISNTNNNQLPSILLGNDRQKQLNSRYTQQSNIQRLLLMADKQKLNDEKKSQNNNKSLEKNSKIKQNENEADDSFESIQEEDNKIQKLKKKRNSLLQKKEKMQNNSSQQVNDSINSQLQQSSAAVDISSQQHKVKTDRDLSNNEKEKLTEKELQQKLQNLLTKQIEGKYVENLQKKAAQKASHQDTNAESLLKSIQKSQQQINYFKYSSIPLKTKKLKMQKLPHQMKDIIDGSSIANTNNKLSVKNLNLNLESSKKKIY